MDYLKALFWTVFYITAFLIVVITLTLFSVNYPKVAALVFFVPIFISITLEVKYFYLTMLDKVRKK